MRGILASKDDVLAIHGGEPIRTSFLPFGAPNLGVEEIHEVIDTLRSGWIGTGPKVLRFEEELSNYIGSKHAISLNSCTAGLFLSLVSLGIGPGDEVLTTPLTFAATVNVIEHVGARPIFVDVDYNTLNINPELMERTVTARTKAIIPVHFGGLACEMDELKEIAKKNELTIIEDAAHAIGTRYKGKMAGSLANLAAFSFYANKNLTTVEGGMVTTNNPIIDEKIRILRMHGLSRDAWERFGKNRFVNSDILLPGFKCNMPDLNASIGIHQLKKQEQFLNVRERYARIYDEAFKDLPLRLQPRPCDLDQNRHSLHLYAIILDASRWQVTRDQLIDALNCENIGAALHYRSIHTQGYYRKKYGYKSGDYPNSFNIGENIFSLPLTPKMNESDVEDVIKAVYKIVEAFYIPKYIRLKKSV